MDTLKFLRLLDDERVVAEIERYKWIESEKLGKDIGKERAGLEWTRAYGHIWLTIHKPKEYKALLDESEGQDRKAQNHCDRGRLFCLSR